MAISNETARCDMEHLLRRPCNLKCNIDFVWEAEPPVSCPPTENCLGDISGREGADAAFNSPMCLPVGYYFLYSTKPAVYFGGHELGKATFLR